MRFSHALVLLLGLVTTQVLAWENHTLASYRAFERMPEVANAANLIAEPLEAFLKDEENTLEALLASQEAWALANLENYPKRPAALAFQADAARSDERRRKAFLMALRVAPNSRFALYFQPDPWSTASASPLPNGVVSTLVAPTGQGHRYLALKPGEPVSALAVLASACDEPNAGLDIYLWEDSPSTWGKAYGLGQQPGGNAVQEEASQAPWHRDFMHESSLVYLAVPALKRTFVLLRSQQFATLSALAFRTGHAYWGWRFAGLSLHYLQDLTQPYHASLAPGISSPRLLGAYALASVGLPAKKYALEALLSKRQQQLEQYLTESLLRNASNRQEGALEKALHSTAMDKSYPDWSERYLREVVSLQASNAATRVAQALLASMPSAYAADPNLDFGTRDPSYSLLDERGLRNTLERARLDSVVAELLENFAAHSRNALRGILRVSDPP